MPTIFISATSHDLASYRRAVRDVLITQGQHSVVEEHFRPEYRSIVAFLDALIAPCDAVICLVGWTYGREPHQRPPEQPPRSYTQMEYDTA